MNRDDLVRLRHARDQIDGEYAQPLDVAALARTALVRNDVSAYCVRWVTIGPPSQPDINDVDAAFDGVQATGAEVIQEPMDQGYGRDCAFRDPAGNQIRIIQQRS